MSQSWRAALNAAALYLIIGANLPYLPVWLEHVRGLSGTEIGAAASVAVLLRTVFGPLTAVWAAQIGLRRTMALLAFALLAAYLALFPDGPHAAVLALAAVIYLVWGAMMPLSEAVLMAATKEGFPDYGFARAIGSAAFVGASLLVGALARAHGPEVVLQWLIGAAILMLASTLYLKDAPPPAMRPSLAQIFAGGVRLYRDRRILTAALAMAFIQSSHAYYYNLGSNIWLRQGIDAAHVGALWSVGVVVEVFLLALSARIFKGWTPGALILLGGAGAALRWSLTSFLPPLEALYAVQMLHALSFAATHLGMILFIAEEVPEDQTALAVAVNSALAFGPLMAVGGVIVGLVYDANAAGGAAAQAQGYWLMAAMAGVGAVLSFGVLRRRQPQSAGVGGATAPSE
ncbi:MAG: MFS transporter [Pseudomonadota bacterium]